MQEIYPHLARAERIVSVSRVRFGGFGGHTRNAIDRWSPMGLGTYVPFNGEMHHDMRYPAPASVVSIGIMGRDGESEEKTFHLASSRIATCVLARRSASVSDLPKQRTSGGVRRGATRRAPRGTLHSGVRPPAPVAASGGADGARRQSYGGPVVRVQGHDVIHSGYLEEIQRQTCFEMCRHFCRETGIVYQGGLGFGARLRPRRQAAQIDRTADETTLRSCRSG